MTVTWKGVLAVALTGAASFGCSSDDESGGDEAGNIGLYARIQNPSAAEAAGRQCQTSTGIEWDLGTPSPSSVSPGQPISGASCRVDSNGDFHVTASGTDPQIMRPNGRIDIDFTGTAREGNDIEASIYTPVTDTIETITLPCTVTTAHHLEAGELWLDFDCPFLEDVNSPAVGCHASGSLALFGCGE